MIPQGVQVFVALDPVDLRCSFDRLSGIAREQIGYEARSGALGYGDFDTTMNVLAKAVEKGPWLMGDQFTAADVVIGANIRWGMIFKMIPERKEFIDYAARIVARPAAQRAEAKDKDLQAQAA